MPKAMSVHRNGIRLTFTDPLDKELAADVESYGVLQWNYKWSADYGSRQWSVARPGEQVRRGAGESRPRLRRRKTVFLEMLSVRPVTRRCRSPTTESTGGDEIRGDIYNTIHELGALRPHPTHRRPRFQRKPRRKPDRPHPAREGGRKGQREAEKVVLIAGKKSHGPGEHEYERGCALLACLETSPNLKGIKTHVVTDGWPSDPKILDDADTIVLFSDGATTARTATRSCTATACNNSANSWTAA